MIMKKSSGAVMGVRWGGGYGRDAPKIEVIVKMQKKKKSGVRWGGVWSGVWGRGGWY